MFKSMSEEYHNTHPSLEELEQLVIQWAKDKGILSKATPYKQAQKTLEEVGELLYAIGKEDRDEIRDSVGDSVVTLIIQAKMQGMTLSECLGAAYEVIKNRVGVMRDGQFHRDDK